MPGQTGSVKAAADPTLPSWRALQTFSLLCGKLEKKNVVMSEKGKERKTYIHTHTHPLTHTHTHTHTQILLNLRAAAVAVVRACLICFLCWRAAVCGRAGISAKTILLREG